MPVISFPSRYLRRRGAVARRAGRQGRGENSQLRQRREQADLGRERAVDLVVEEVPAPSRNGRAPRRASGTRRNSQVRRRRGIVGLAEDCDGGRRRGRRACRAVPEIAAARRVARRDEEGIANLGLASRDAAKLGRECAGDLVGVEGPVTPRGGRAPRRASGTRGNSQRLQLRELAELGRERAGNLVAAEGPTTPRGGLETRRASGTRGELAGASAP